jgi:endonuclease/exonuclease/phosphatase family metal-dependent hydrolase
MAPRAALLAIAGAAALAACGGAPAEPADAGAGAVWLVQANIAGGWADGAEASGVDDVTVALERVVRGVEDRPLAVFVNEACESHASHLATRLGRGWQAFFVRTWDGHSDCFPAPGATEGRFGNAVVVRDPEATALVIPSCNDAAADAERCLPNWAPPAEQRRGICARTSRDADALLCSFHLDPRHWSPHDDQLAALGRIADALAAEHTVVVMGGDLNDGPSRVASAFDARFVDLAPPAPTYPASRPRRAIDHILVAGAPAVDRAARAADLGRCSATWRDDGACSDHLAVVGAMALR